MPNLPETGSALCPESTYVASNDGIIELEVGTPILVKQTMRDHHAYPIIGKDSNGPIECHRRYSHFEKFRLCLLTRYPGLYVPPIPSKQAMGKTDVALAQERQYFLDLFMKKCCEIRYLAVSAEMQIFLRPNGDIEKLLDNVPKPRTNDMLGMFRVLVPVNEVSKFSVFNSSLEFPSRRS